MMHPEFRRIQIVRSKTETIPWESLEQKEQNTLKLLLSTATDAKENFLHGFTYNDLQRISEETVADTRAIGVGRVSYLVDALCQIFENESVVPLAVPFGKIPCERDFDELIPWSYLDRKDATALLKILKTKQNLIETFKDGFTYNNLLKVTNEDLRKARFYSSDKLRLLEVSLFAIFTSNSTILPSLRIQIRDSQSCEEIVALIEKMILDEDLQSSRNLEIAKNRMLLFFGGVETLDAIGQKYGLTRERTRQITEKVRKIRLDIENSVLLNEARKLLTESSSLSNFGELAFDKGFTVKPDLSPKWFMELATILGDTSFLTFAKNELPRLQVGTDDLDKFNSSIQRFRTKIGIIDMQEVAVQTGFSYDSILIAIRKRYPTALMYKNVVLARASGFSTIFESTLAKQLMIRDGLELKELSIGVRRVSNYRGAILEIEEEILLELIRQVVGDPSSIQNMDNPLIKELKFSNHEKWLISIFGETESGLLHRDQISEKALRDGVSLGSLAIYLTYVPFLRLVAPSVFALVGTNHGDQQILEAKEIAKESSFQTEVAYQIAGNLINMELRANMNTISSGVVFPPKELAFAVKEITFKSICVCGGLESEQTIRMTKDGFWVGFSAILRHAFATHNVSETGTLLLKFDLKNKTASIAGNT